MRGCGFQVAKSIVQDRVSSYQRGFKNRHRNMEVWKGWENLVSCQPKFKDVARGRGLKT